jgi:Tfp pilus assembly protein PilV
MKEAAKTKNRGMGIIEVVIGATIIAIGILAMIQAFGLYVNYALANDKNTQAAYLMEESLEAMSFLRDGSWNGNIKSLSTTTTYYIAWSSTASSWLTTTTPQYVDGVFLRQITLSDVFRDSNGNIASSGTFDPNTKFVTTTLKYFQGHATTTQTASTYITNLYGN